MQNFKQWVNRFFHSSVVTFLTGFILEFFPLIEEAIKNGTLDEAALKGAFVGAVLVGIRAVAKVLYEGAVPKN